MFNIVQWRINDWGKLEGLRREKDGMAGGAVWGWSVGVWVVKKVGRAAVRDEWSFGYGIEKVSQTFETVFVTLDVIV